MATQSINNQFTTVSQRGLGGPFVASTVGTTTVSAAPGVTVSDVLFTVGAADGPYDIGVLELKAGSYVRDAAFALDSKTPAPAGTFELGLAATQGGAVVDVLIPDGAVATTVPSAVVPFVVGANTWLVVEQTGATAGETLKVRVEVVEP